MRYFENSLNIGDTAVFLYNLDLDGYTFARIGQKVKIEEKFLNSYDHLFYTIKFDNSGKEFNIEEPYLIREDKWRELSRSVIQSLANSV